MPGRPQYRHPHDALLNGVNWSRVFRVTHKGGVAGFTALEALRGIFLVCLPFCLTLQFNKP